MILADAVQSALFLDDAQAEEITGRIAAQLSEAQAEEAVRALPAPAGRTDNRQVPATIGTLMKAIHTCTPVQFRYYDMSPSFRIWKRSSPGRMRRLRRRCWRR